MFITISKSIFWFVVGAGLGLFFSVSFLFIIFKYAYANKVYPGISIDNVNVGGKTKQQVIDYFATKNSAVGNTTFTFTYNDVSATISAKDIGLGYDTQLMSDQAFAIGRSNYFLSDVFLTLKAYIQGITLSSSYTYNDDKVTTVLQPLVQAAQVDPIEALFSFENGRVTAFRPSVDGQMLDTITIKNTITSDIPMIMRGEQKSITIQAPIKILHPHTTTQSANNLGIQELIGTGTSLYQHSIPSRIHNVNLAATRLNGILIAPDQVFSFDDALGDVSQFTGYQQAYVIQNGKTVLGDGGGVCQVSTTMFRAALNAGLPIVERHGHAYRVGYYEEDSPPGIDATVYVPTVDFKFKNDTGHYILIQTVIDPTTLRLTFNFYGTNDGRQVKMTTPVVTNETPPLPTVYTDDPTLPKGQLVQTDFAAGGATATFSRTVTKDNKVLDNDTFVTTYQPWAAAYRRGTM